MNTPACKHCGGEPERATTTDNRTVLSDSCYGCRNRYTEALKQLDDACFAISEAQQLMGLEDSDRRGIALEDSIGALWSHATGIRTLVRNALYDDGAGV